MKSIPSRRRFVLVQGILMYGVGLSLVFAGAMTLAFDQAEFFQAFLIGLPILCSVGALWAFFMHEQIRRRYQQRAAALKSD